jgi:hypothetical protein
LSAGVGLGSTIPPPPPKHTHTHTQTDTPPPPLQLSADGYLLLNDSVCLQTWVYHNTAGQPAVRVHVRGTVLVPAFWEAEPQPRSLLAGELACTLAHLQAAVMAYRAAAAPQHVLVVEDDASFSLAPHWHDMGLAAAVAALPDDWGVCQLCLRASQRATHERRLARLASGHLVSRRSTVHDWDSWATASYLLHRRGIAALLDAFWPGGSRGPLLTLDEMAEQAAPGNIPTIDLRAAPETLADVLLYSLPGTYLTNRPLIIANDEGGGPASSIHSSHDEELAQQNRLIRSLYYAGPDAHDATAPADRCDPRVVATAAATATAAQSPVDSFLAALGICTGMCQELRDRHSSAMGPAGAPRATIRLLADTE